MRLEQIKDEVGKLALSEKLLILEDIWDSTAASNSETPMALWQKKELDRRYDEYKEAKLELHDWEQVHCDLRKKYR